VICEYSLVCNLAMSLQFKLRICGLISSSSFPIQCFPPSHDRQVGMETELLFPSVVWASRPGVQPPCLKVLLCGFSDSKPTKQNGTERPTRRDVLAKLDRSSRKHRQQAESRKKTTRGGGQRMIWLHYSSSSIITHTMNASDAVMATFRRR
jgi:hypothetical protein